MIPDPILPESDEDEDGFQRMQILVQDWPDQARLLFVIISRTLQSDLTVRSQELLTHFKEANAFIDGTRVTAQEGVLVYWFVATVVLGPESHSVPFFESLSHQGVSRSTTTVAAYCALLTRPLFCMSDASIARGVSVMTSRPPLHDDTAALAFLRS